VRLGDVDGFPRVGDWQRALWSLRRQRRARAAHLAGFDVLYAVLTPEISIMLKCLAPLKNNLRDRASQRLIGLLMVLGPSLAFAELPTMEAPSRGEGSGLIETIKNYAYDGGILLGLLIALLAFLGVAWHSLTVYADVQNQRKTWKDLGAVVGIGALLVVIIIWFLTKAAAIL
jgi:integrating conjugative element membrane protein (TIGR03745 family)